MIAIPVGSKKALWLRVPYAWAVRAVRPAHSGYGRLIPWRVKLRLRVNLPSGSFLGLNAAARVWDDQRRKLAAPATSFLQSVGRFPQGEALAGRMKAAGLRETRWHRFTMGVATLYVGEKGGSGFRVQDSGL